MASMSFSRTARIDAAGFAGWGKRRLRLSSARSIRRAAASAPFSEPAIPLAHYCALLNRHRAKIFAVVLLATVAALVVCLGITPVYEATAIIDIDHQGSAGILGQDTSREIPDPDQFLATQIQLIQSDAVIRPVAERFGVREQEKRFPGLARLKDRVDRLFHSDPAPDAAPIRLRQLDIMRPPNTYLLRVSYRSPDAGYAAEIANAVVRSYLEHAVKLRRGFGAGIAVQSEAEIGALRARMRSNTERMLELERELEVSRPEEETTLIATRWLKLHAEWTNAQTERMEKQVALQAIREGSLASAQVSPQGEGLQRLAQRENEAQEKFAQVRAQFGSNHPEYKKAATQLAEVQAQIERGRQNTVQRVEVEYRQAAGREALLGQAVERTRKEFGQLNARRHEYEALQHDADGDRKLYEELVRKVREAGINASLQIGSMRLTDPARPAGAPVFPRTALTLAVTFFMTAMVAGGTAIVSHSWDKTLRDPQQAASLLPAEVIGTLPEVKSWRFRTAPSVVAEMAEAATGASRPAYSQAARALRSSIQLANCGRHMRSLLVTSAVTGEGKSTLAAHLVVAYAVPGCRTLLIDADLRHPAARRRFGLPASVGLSDVLSARIGWRDAVLRSPVGNVYVLPAGLPSSGTWKHLGERLSELLADAASDYDLVVLDAPPVLAGSDSMEMAAAADAVLLVGRAGRTDRRAIAHALAILERWRAHVLGFVLNGCDRGSEPGYDCAQYTPPLANVPLRARQTTA